jgi:hypothetical protein
MKRRGFGFPNESTIVTSKMNCGRRCEQLEQKVKYKFVFGDDVVKEILDHYGDRRRGLKTKAGESKGKLSVLSVMNSSLNLFCFVSRVFFLPGV